MCVVDFLRFSSYFAQPSRNNDGQCILCHQWRLTNLGN